MSRGTFQLIQAVTRADPKAFLYTHELAGLRVGNVYGAMTKMRAGPAQLPKTLTGPRFSYVGSNQTMEVIDPCTGIFSWLWMVRTWLRRQYPLRSHRQSASERS